MHHTLVFAVCALLCLHAVQHSYANISIRPDRCKGRGYHSSVRNKVCLYVSKQSEDYATAYKKCEGLGLALATPYMHNVDKYMRKVLRKQRLGNEFWLGAKRHDGIAGGGFVWDMGYGVRVEDLQHQNWVSGQPDNTNNNEACMATWTDYKWNDIPCDTKKPYVCMGRYYHL